MNIAIAANTTLAETLPQNKTILHGETSLILYVRQWVREQLAKSSTTD
ncbi:hypothetical protein [Nostoc sp. PCC 7107]|nr:hypothetical protein [Nostoc sp. PCC 7107]AFY41367.1 hypothetical protein Nos7107_0697 [Nostoc sp. PCC 7107]